MLLDFLLVALGVVLLYGGGEALVSGASALARRLGMSPLVVGLTVVAFGTSAPELAATLAAALQGSPEVAFGNVVGSNVFNVLAILGTTSLVVPIEIDVGLGAWGDLLVMLGFSVALWPFLYSRRRLDRWEGAVLLVAFAAYMGWLFA
jgi:cation:H+ antiporter